MQTASALPAAHPAKLTDPQVLLFDADDTLWENNIYFERAIESFVELIAHPELTPSEVREAFDRLEATRVKTHGYGTEAFHASLLAGFEHLTGTACDNQQALRVADCAMHVRSGDMVLLPGVADTLDLLATAHQLVLVTKGDPAEQKAKLLRSGLSAHFTHVEVLPEKHVAAYQEILARYCFEPGTTWMIGNSPRSDINPALAAGLHAVYLPHPSTWILEQEPVAAPSAQQHLLHLDRFADLLHVF